MGDRHDAPRSSQRLLTASAGLMNSSQIQRQMRKQSKNASDASLRHVNMTLSLAFLSLALTKAAVEGRLPRGIGLERLRELTLEWDLQFEALSLGST